MKKKEKTLEQRQKEFEAKVTKVQAKLEKLIKANGLSLVAGYNKEKNIISLELIPRELADAQNQLVKQNKELIEGKGDAISGNNSQDNSAPETKIPDGGGLDIPKK